MYIILFHVIVNMVRKWKLACKHLTHPACKLYMAKIGNFMESSAGHADKIIVNSKCVLKEENGELSSFAPIRCGIFYGKHHLFRMSCMAFHSNHHLCRWWSSKQFSIGNIIIFACPIQLSIWWLYFSSILYNITEWFILLEKCMYNYSQINFIQFKENFYSREQWTYGPT